MNRVLINPSQMQGEDSLCARLLVEAGFEVVFPPGDGWMPGPEELIRLLDGIDATVASSECYSWEVIAASRLRVISRAGVGYDAVDVRAASEQGVVLAITSGAVSPSVVEHTLALILAVFRGIVARDAEVRRGTWSRRSLPRLAGKTLGIIGLGEIGKALVPKAQALGLKVMACDPQWDSEFAAAHGVARAEFAELLSRADIISLHAPATDATAGMIDAAALERVRPSCVLINTARGKLVDEPALAAALHEGRLAGAGLDVFAVEPAPLDSPLLKAPNTVLATHMGGLDDESGDTMARLAAQNIIDLKSGRWPAANIINKQLGPAWQW